MEYYKKNDELILEELLCNEKSMGIKEFLEISLKIVDSLTKIHKKNIIYKYLNPKNIIVTKNKNIRLMECKFICRDINYNLKYMAPEQIRGVESKIDFRADYYSLGVILYKMLTQKLPLEEVSYCHIAKEPISPRNVDNLIPTVISEIIMKLLSKDPEDRYKSSYGIKTDLKKCYNSLLYNGFIYNFSLGEKDISDKLKFTDEIYGREKEINEIMDKYDMAANGSLQWVVISGDIGIGKTIVANEVSRRIIKKGGILISSKCKKYNNNVSYYPLIECGRMLINKILMEDEKEISNLKKEILNAVGNNGQIITRFIPEAEFLIGRQPPLEEIGFIEAKNRFNMVFIRFIRTILSRKKPIAFFLEDIQWLDEGSLNIIERFILNKENKYLFIMTTLRPDAIENNKFLKKILNEDRDNENNISNVRLGCLDKENVENLLCDTLWCSKDSIKELAKLINLRTDGNPFFIKSSMESMYFNEILKFDYNYNKWTWDINSARNMKIENSIFEIIIRKINSLPQNTKNILKIASCIGVEFCLKSISDILNTATNEVIKDIIPAIKEGLILFDKNEINDEKNRAYKFSHSQIQIQIYDDIEEEKKIEYHLRIGRYFYNKFLHINLENGIFEAINQLNKGKDLIVDNKEIYNLIRLNLTAGLKHKAAGIHKASLEYFKVAYNLLEENSWEKDYDLTYAVSIELAECEFMNKNFEKAEKLFNIILKNVKTPWETIKIYNMKVCIYTYFRQVDKAIETGINGLKVLGIHISKHPRFAKVCCEGLKSQLRKKKIIGIYNKFIIKEKKVMQELRKLFFNMSFLSIVYDKNLFKLLVLKEMQINTYNKKTINEVFTCMNYEFLIMNLLKKYNKSYEAGYEDLRRCYKNIDTMIYAKSYTLFSNFMVLWSKSYNLTLNHLHRCYDICMEAGEVSCAAFTVNSMITVLFMKGENLSDVNKKISKYMDDVEKSNFEDIREELASNKKIIDILTGDESEEYILDESKNNINSLTSIGQYTYKIILNYILGRYRDSIDIIKEREKNINTLDGIYIDILYYIFACLTTIKLFEDGTETEKIVYMKKIKLYMRKIKKKVNSNPDNFLNFYMLIKAEVYRINNKGYKLERLYDEAIKIATKQNMINNIALISEIAGNHYRAQGNITVSRLYLIQAYTFYKKWGCKLKVKYLQNKHPEIFKNNSNIEEDLLIEDISNKLYIDDMFECSIKMKRNKYEFMKFIKAFQSISGEIVLENLLKELMINLIESIGAERGCLILNKNNKLLVEIEGNIDEIYSMTDSPISVEHYNKISKLLVNYVVRTRKSVLLKNGKNEEVVFDDKYIVDNNIKSILCTPIKTKEKVIGVIYLENRFSSDIFNKKRLNIVKLIASQAAISIENACMYKEINELNEQLKKTVDERTKSLNESIKYEEMRTEFFANISHELRTPLNVIFGGYQMLKVILQNEELTNKNKIEKYMGTIKQNCYRLVRLINNLIDITKIDSGFFQLNLINVNIINVVETITLSVAQYIESKGINLVFDTTVEEKIMACDVDKIERIILNLLSNAIKFTNSGGNIFVNMYEEDDNIVISVKDDGIGIPKEKQDIIFDRFIQVDKSLSRNREGSGIGLSLVKSIVELHKGNIYLKSELGKGSEFIIKLPCNVLETQDENAEKYSNADSNKIEKIMIEFSDIYS